MDISPATFLLNPQPIQSALDRAHLAHKDFADHLGISRAYWSQLFNRKRRVTPMVRQLLVKSKYLEGIEHDELWEVELSAETAA